MLVKRRAYLLSLLARAKNYIGGRLNGVFHLLCVGAVLQPGAIADLGVETLAGCQSFVFLDEREQVERHLIVAAPRNV